MFGSSHEWPLLNFVFMFDFVHAPLRSMQQLHGLFGLASLPVCASAVLDAFKKCSLTARLTLNLEQHR